MQQEPDRRAARRLLIALTMIATAGAATGQTTWYVDDDDPNDPTPGVSGLGFPFSSPSEDGSSAAPFDDIQKALDAAASGDTVLVRPSNWFGYYALTPTFGSLDFGGKALVVRSTGGPLVTAVDGSLLAGSSGVVIDASGAGTVFEGFTVQNCDRGSTASAVGGGLFVQASSPTIRSCRFVANHAYSGGGVFVSSGSPRFEDCAFLANHAAHQGGGVYTTLSSPDFERCEFESNTATFGAGALFRTAAGNLIEVVECLFLANESLDTYGGGLAKFDQGDLDVVRSRFVGNVSGKGGAAQLHGPARIRECQFVANVSLTGTVNTDAGGSGLGGTTVVSGSTFTQNAGGAATETVGSLILRNCIAWNDSPFELGAGVTAEHCDVLGGWPGTGNLDVDPLFVDAWGPDGVLGTLDDDLRIASGSPCIDAGDTTELGGAALPLDLAGERRVLDDPSTPDTGVVSLWLSIDIGAFEYQPPVAPVRPKVLTKTLP